MVAMAHMKAEKINKPYGILEVRTLSTTGSVTTKHGIVKVHKSASDGIVSNGHLTLTMAVNGFLHTWDFHNQVYSERYIITLARRMSESLHLRNSR